jgi:nucleotide-binding universal stress UspA family protein
VVPLDGTPQAAAALPVARAVASVTEGQLVLIRVVSPAHLVGEPERYLWAIAHELQDVRADCVVRHGPAREILAAASAAQADLIVMATHGSAGLQHVLAGSVSERVLADSRIPVLLVRPGGKSVTSLHTLLVPTDGTPGAALALGAAVGLARASDARLELVQAVEPVPPWIYGDDYGVAPVYLDSDWEAETLRAAKGYVEGIVERLGTAGNGGPAFPRAGVQRQSGAHHPVCGRRGRRGPHCHKHTVAHRSRTDLDRQHRRRAAENRQASRASGASDRWSLR